MADQTESAGTADVLVIWCLTALILEMKLGSGGPRKPSSTGPTMAARRGGTYNNNRPPRRAPGQPPRRRFDPRNNVQNRQGAYVLDRQLADAQRRAHQAEQAVVALAAGQATTSTQVNPPAAAMTAAATPALRQARSRAAAAPATSNVNVQSIIRNLVDLA